MEGKDHFASVAAPWCILHTLYMASSPGLYLSSPTELSEARILAPRELHAGRGGHGGVSLVDDFELPQTSAIVVGLHLEVQSFSGRGS